jgi:hypothetical protein
MVLIRMRFLVYTPSSCTTYMERKYFYSYKILINLRILSDIDVVSLAIFEKAKQNLDMLKLNKV